MSLITTKVSLWNRVEEDPSAELDHVLELFTKHHIESDNHLIKRAYVEAQQAHDGQIRRSGDAYITHPVAVAEIVASLGLDEPTIIAALLHDTLEDTEEAFERIEEIFGGEVASIVDGVTKLERIKFETKEAQQAASMRKMLVAVAKDIRVLLIKLADRLHNMRDSLNQ